MAGVLIAAVVVGSTLAGGAAHPAFTTIDVVIDRLVASDDIRSIIPGVIRPVRDAKGTVKIRITVPTQNGWKAIGLCNGARQEMFVSTNLSRENLEEQIRKALSS